jgi:hypothetical protein
MALSGALRIVSAPTMISTCIQLLRTHDTDLQIELYKLLVSRIGEVDILTRKNMTADILMIVANIKETLVTSQDEFLSTATLMALESLAHGPSTVELSTFTAAIPVVIDKLSISTRASINTLESLWCVPYFF